MSILSFIPGGALTAAAGLFLGALALLWRVFAAGRKAERIKQLESDVVARDIADQVDNDIGAMTPLQRREALRKWSK